MNEAALSVGTWMYMMGMDLWIWWIYLLSTWYFKLFRRVTRMSSKDLFINTKCYIASKVGDKLGWYTIKTEVVKWGWRREMRGSCGSLKNFLMYFSNLMNSLYFHGVSWPYGQAIGVANVSSLVYLFLLGGCVFCIRNFVLLFMPFLHPFTWEACGFLYQYLGRWSTSIGDLFSKHKLPMTLFLLMTHK